MLQESSAVSATNGGRKCILLYVNFVSDGGSLLETVPQGDASMPVELSADAEAVIAGLLTSDEIAAALARLFLARATAGERAVR